jgi:hypothetical protein
MGIIRTIHNRENPYVMLNKITARDNSLSLKARGLLLMCMSYPDDWTFHVKTLIKECQEGRTAIYHAIDELINAGYVVKYLYSERSNGKFIDNEVIYQFYEFKLSPEERQIEIEKLKKSLRHSGFRNSDNGDTENQHLLSNDVNQVTEITDILDLGPETETSDKSDFKTLGVAKRWKLTEGQAEAFEWLKSKGIDATDAKLAYWAKHFSMQRLIDVYNESVHNRPRSMRLYMSHLLDNKKTVHNARIQANLDFAKDFCEAHKWYGVKFLKKYIKFKFGDHLEEMPLDMESPQFIVTFTSKFESTQKRYT